MFDKAIASFGGMKTFVPRGSKVLVKPNIGWDVPPERGGNTNPKLVARIIEQLPECRSQRGLGLRSLLRQLGANL